jgi:GNAT superfamily N-acetyltransferase
MLEAGYEREHRLAMFQVEAPGREPKAEPHLQLLDDEADWKLHDRLTREDWNRWPSETGEQVARLFRYWAATIPDRFYIAYLGSQPVGRVGLLQHRTMGYIHGLITLPAWRRRGLGTAILRLAEVEARAAGCDRISLLCDADSWLPVFYGRLGYVPVGEEHAWMKRR